MIATAIKTFETMTLKEILRLHNKSLFEKYIDTVKSLKSDKITKEVVEENYGESIIDIIEAVEQTKLEIKSNDLFPDQPITIFPGIKEVRAKEDYVCNFSGAKISKGSLYVNYRPMAKNIVNGDVYVLRRTIITELAYEYDLPTNIGELEVFNNKIQNYENYADEEIQYDRLYAQGGLQFKKLSRRKK